MPGSSLESDLRAAREAQGLSLEDIQSETRIPVHILRQFEDGRLVGDPTYNEVYLRAFLKSYAKSVGMSQHDVLESYDRSRGKTSAAPAAPAVPPVAPSAPPKPPQPDPPAATPPPRPTSAPSAAAPAPEAPASSPAPSAAPPAVAAASSTRDTTASPAPAAVASTGGRVRKPPVPSARRSFDKNWGTIIGLFVVVVAVLGAAIWFLVLRDDGQDLGASPMAQQQGTEDRVAQIDSVGIGAGSGTNAPQFQTPISVKVYAGGNGLQNFRVTAAPEERLGHWVEVGDSKTFTSDLSIVLWGEGGDGFSGDAVVELQGQRWSPSGTTPIRIDAASGQSLLDSLAARPAGSIPAIPGAPEAGE